MNRINVSAAAISEALSTLDLQAMGLERLAERLEAAGADPRDIAQAREHAQALEALREDLALSVPEGVELEE